MYPAGNGSKTEINGRSLKDLVAQVNRYCNTKRTVKGILSKSAGLVPDMEPIVKQFVKNPINMQQDTIKMFETQEKSTQSNGEYKIYAHVMKLIVKNGPEVVEKEIKRLTTLINGEGIDANKADEFTIRRNVLAVFADALGVNVGDLDNDDVLETPENGDAAEEVSEEIKEF
jgi:protein disulfide-isomerase A6